MRLLAGLAMLCATAALGDDFIEVPGQLPDGDFYRLVSCEAEPGAPCPFEHVRWNAVDAADLTVSILETAHDYPHPAEATSALQHAIGEINGLETAVTLRRVPDGQQAHITVHLSAHDEGETISGIGLNGVDGATIPGAYVHIFWNNKRDLTRGVIIFARDLAVEDIKPVMLEEFVQSLGLLTDVRSPWYETRSVFSQDSNLVTKLAGQDAMVLRRHYPPAE